MIEIAPSFLSADLNQIHHSLPDLQAAGCRFLHLDIMDGHFVPNISFGPAWVQQLRPGYDFVFDAHLMVEEPDWLLPRFAEAGCDYCTVHVEAMRHLDRGLHLIRDLGMKPGVALNPSTPLVMIDQVLDLVDIVIVMGVNPGYSGQKFIPYTLDKLQRLAELRQQRHLDFLIEMDGGASVANAQQLVQAGADVLVAGSAVFGQSDPAAAFRAMSAAANAVCG